MNFSIYKYINRNIESDQYNFLICKQSDQYSWLIF